MIDFMFLYEVRTRELESILILGNELKNRGYTVEYCSILEFAATNRYRNNMRLKKYRDKVRVLLVPSFYHDKEMINYFLPFGKIEKIVDLRWEQYYVNEVMDHPTDNTFLYPCESGKNAYHVCWGEVSHQNMIDVGIPEDRLLDTGPIHMDMLREAFRTYYKSKKDLMRQYGLNENKKTVLFISSFSNATDRTQYLQYLNDFFSGKYKIDRSRIDMEQASYELALKWFDDFMANHSDVTFIYRPHPSESITEKLRKLETKYQEFKIITDYSVKQWILSSDIIVTWMSTAIIEAYFANKACFIIRPIEYPIEKDMCVYKDAKFITSEEEFMDITNVICRNSLSDGYVLKCYDVHPTNPSYIRLSDTLEKILVIQDFFPTNFANLRQNQRGKQKSLMKGLRSALKRNIIICGAALLSAIKKYVNISFGDRIEDTIQDVQKLRLQIHHQGDFEEINSAIEAIVKKQAIKRLTSVNK